VRLLIIILLTSTINLWGQSKDELCKSGTRTAKEKLAEGHIYFPRYIFDSSITLRKILEMDFGIIDGIYSELCIELEEELKCHDQLMRKAIEEKWGRHFLKRQRHIADKLLKQNKGFKEAFNREAKKGIEKEITKDYVRTDYKRRSYDLVLTISTTGQVTNYKIFYASLFGVGQEVDDEIELRLIRDALKNYMNNWTPGEIKGKPIEMITILNIEI
jgi:hypothetical protein